MISLSCMRYEMRDVTDVFKVHVRCSVNTSPSSLGRQWNRYNDLPLGGLLQCFSSSFYQFSLYSSGHQIFMCVFEMLYVAEKCLMLLYPGNKSSVSREQAL